MTMTLRPLRDGRDNLAGKNIDPNLLFNHLIISLNLKNDAALSRALEIAPPVISKVRHRRLNVTPSLLVRIHDVTELPIQTIRDLMLVPAEASGEAAEPAPAAEALA